MCIAPAAIAMPKLSPPGRDANRNITIGSVSSDPNAKKLAAPNSPSDDIPTNARVMDSGLAISGSSMSRIR
jgi:hypothetical protein